MLAQQINIAPIDDIQVVGAGEVGGSATLSLMAYSAGMPVAVATLFIGANTAQSWLAAAQPTLENALVLSDVAMPGAYADLKAYYLAQLAANGGSTEATAQAWLTSKNLLPARAA